MTHHLLPSQLICSSTPIQDGIDKLLTNPKVSISLDRIKFIKEYSDKIKSISYAGDGFFNKAGRFIQEEKEETYKYQIELFLNHPDETFYWHFN